MTKKTTKKNPQKNKLHDLLTQIWCISCYLKFCAWLIGLYLSTEGEDALHANVSWWRTCKVSLNALFLSCHVGVGMRLHWKKKRKLMLRQKMEKQFLWMLSWVVVGMRISLLQVKRFLFNHLPVPLFLYTCLVLNIFILEKYVDTQVTKNASYLNSADRLQLAVSCLPGIFLLWDRKNRICIRTQYNYFSTNGICL